MNHHERFMGEDVHARVPEDVREAIARGDLQVCQRAGTGPDAADVYARRRFLKILRGFLRLATPAQRNILELHYGRGFTHEVIAKRLGIARSTVSVQIIRFWRRIEAIA